MASKATATKSDKVLAQYVVNTCDKLYEEFQELAEDRPDYTIWDYVQDYGDSILMTLEDEAEAHRHEYQDEHSEYLADYRAAVRQERGVTR